jgi:hypothetical protein
MLCCLVLCACWLVGWRDLEQAWEWPDVHG